MIDLRSDTQTRPSQAMRTAMATAEVGDEQSREDPTVLELERRGAELLGQEEAVYLPTATMANQIALMILGERGTELVVEETAHIMVSELGGAAMHGGLQTRGLPGTYGRLSPDQIRATMHEDGSFHTPRTSVVALENTHNNAGGTVWPVDDLRAVVSTARELGLKLHLDGARLLNAAVATAVPASELGASFDTVSLCLSKGLGCPLGALIAGSAELMLAARLEKHRFGGAMRQAGIVAAAGLYALDHNVERLAEDHARARQLAEAWIAQGVPLELARVQSNFVQIDVQALGLGEWEAIALLEERGVGLSRTMRSGILRAVTHLDLTDDDIERALELVPEALEPVSEFDALDRLLAERQADRLPSVAAAVVRDGEIIWSSAIGAADYEAGVEAKPNTQYRIGSITKTFTATAIMQLRAEGLLDLDDRLEQHLDGVANGSPTIRRLLCHLSGLQREAGEMFVTGESPTAGQLIDSMADAEFVLAPAQQHHYSNLAFALLGQLVARKRGKPYTEVVDERIIGPLRLERTTWEGAAPKAQGYLVDEYARTVWTEPETDLGGAAPAGQLWSTVNDLCRWASFLASGHDDVLAVDAVEEMWFPQVMYFPHDWVLGWGLGLMLYNPGGAIYGGHDGAMAGHLAGVFIDRKSKTGAAALTNSGTRGDMALFAVSLAAKAAELRPPAIEPWHPESEPPPDVRAVLGRWWSEGNEFVFWWQDGTLQAKVAGMPPGRGETTFERDGDGWRAARGRERGERLRIDGGQLVWAGYPFTRVQEPFKA